MENNEQMTRKEVLTIKLKTLKKRHRELDQKIATLRVVYDQELVGEYDLLSSKEVKKVNFISRLIKSINYLIWGDV